MCFPNTGNKAKISASPFYIFKVVLASAIGEKKSLLMRKYVIKLCLLANDTIIYIENFKIATKISASNE